MANVSHASVAAIEARINGWLQRIGATNNSIPADAWRPPPPADTCERLVPRPQDAAPFRAPLAVYSALLERVRGMRVVFVGESSSDPMQCLLHSAVSVTATILEPSESECLHLKSRAARLLAATNRTFAVVCGDPLQLGTAAHVPAVPDADMYVIRQSSWRLIQPMLWLRRHVKQSACRAHFGVSCDLGDDMRLNHVDSFDVLHALRLAQRTRAAVSAAEVSWAAVFDEATDHDGWTYHQLHHVHSWSEWNASFCVDRAELANCLRHSVAAGSRSAYHICARPHSDRFLLLGGELSAARHAARQSGETAGSSTETASSSTSSTETAGSGSTCAAMEQHPPRWQWNATKEEESLRRHGRITRLAGLTAAITATGEMLCGTAADRALEQHVGGGGHGGGAARTSTVARGGLVFVHTFRQVASEFAASSHFMGLSSAQQPMLHGASLLVVSTNWAVPLRSLLRWLGWYRPFQAPREAAESSSVGVSGGPGSHGAGGRRAGLRLLLHTAANLGYSCAEFHSLAATVRVWRRFPWVLAFSGPDVLALPGEYALLQRLISEVEVEQARAVVEAARAVEQATQQPHSHAQHGRGESHDPRFHRPPRTTALLYDRFRASINDPLSMKGEPRFNMDAFVFFPPQWLVPHDERHRDEHGMLARSAWATAAAHCVRGTRNRPEAVLHVVQQEHNLTVRIIGNGSRGSMYDIGKFTRSRPDALIWHVHKMPNVLRYIREGPEGPKPKSLACAAQASRD